MSEHRQRAIAKLLVALALLTVPCSAHAYTYKILHVFDAKTGDGSYSMGSPILGNDGSIYGTTEMGGGVGINCGTVFKYAMDGTYSIVHKFAGWEQNDGCVVKGALIQDRGGNLYGATTLGGTYGAVFSGGTIFKIAPDGTETILHSFYYWNNRHDGDGPFTGPVLDTAGNLYGVTPSGGKHVCQPDQPIIYCGVVYKLKPDGTFKLLYSFKSRNDSAFPVGALVLGDDGYLYGTAPETTDHNYGIVFRIPTYRSPLTTVYAFPPRHTKGGNPYSLIRDNKGHFYGTTNTGGDFNQGTIFKVSADGHERVLHSFNGSDGSGPWWGNLVMDEAGNLYGTTYYGGISSGGVVYQLTPDGTLNVLHSFDCQTEGCYPIAGVALDQAGNIYGTTTVGHTEQYGGGTFYELVK